MKVPFLILHFLHAIFLLIFLTKLESAHQIGVTSNKWTLRMVHNLRWDHSKSFLAVRPVDARGPKHLGNRIPEGLEDAKMSFLLGMGSPNMQIRWHHQGNEDDPAGCDIGVISDSSLNLLENYPREPSDCAFERKKTYQFDGEIVQKEKLTAFCPVVGVPLTEWKLANGTFNKPQKQTQCLHDFNVAATDTNEFNLLRYCAKGYFFNGKDHTDESRFRLRENWLLYLAEGHLSCGISANVEADRALLGRGFKVELVHRFDRHRFFKEMAFCPPLEATLCAYGDKRLDGRFFIAAVVGAGQLDGEWELGGWGRQKRFWANQTYKDEYATMNLDQRTCYLLYHKLLQRNGDGEHKGRYSLELRVTHHCNGRAMRETVGFDASIKRTPDGIYEDSGLTIDLSGRRMLRSTGQMLCAIDGGSLTGNETSSPPTCEPTDAPALLPLPAPAKKLDENCIYDWECPPRARCLMKRYELKRGWKSDFTSYMAPEKLICAKMADEKPPAEAQKCKDDLQCPGEDYCFGWDFELQDRARWCKRLRFKEEGEPCWDGMHWSVFPYQIPGPECFPGLKCDKAAGENEYGNCRQP